MKIEEYIDSINKRYKLGNATEHTFRGDLQQLIETLVPEIRATNEPKRQSCGAPDYIITKKDIPIGFIEAKDIGDKDLDGLKKTGNREQFDRYKEALNNIIFTDYLDFHLYRNGELVHQIAIAELVEGKSTPSFGQSTTPSFGHPSKGGEFNSTSSFPSSGGVRGGSSSGWGGRLRVYLTNSLEESHPDTGTLFASWLSSEANEANHIKRDTPVMVVLGNPPYSGESANKGEWIMSLMEDYKMEPGGKEKLKERNPKWINDDYVKFIRYGQHYIEKNGSGVLAFINPHGYLDNPTFRGMRWNLLKTYDKIYTIDLHGNAKKKETAPDGSKDENVFDIMQGVSINIFIKTGKKKEGELGKVYHYDLYGKRELKYDFLINNNLKSIDFKELKNVAPMYFMVEKDFDVKSIYDMGISVNELFPVNGVGLTTAHDEFVINESKTKILKRFEDFQNTERDVEILHRKFNVNKKDGWNILDGYDNIKYVTDLSKYIEPISYRPFDNRFVFYEDKLVWRTVRKVMKHFLKGENVGLAGIRTNKEKDEIGYTNVFITKNISEARLADRFITNLFPLYLYPDSSGENTQEMQKTTTPAPPSLCKKVFLFAQIFYLYC